MSQNLYKHNCVLLNEAGEKLAEKVIETDSRFHPVLIEAHGDYYLYSHDAQVQGEVGRRHYFKPVQLYSTKQSVSDESVDAMFRTSRSEEEKE